MSKPKFTPGPWRTDCRLIGGQIRITQVPNANMTVAQVNGRQGEQEANARLIAAAPELLEALERLMLSRDASWTGGHDWEEALDEAAAALAKARGES